MDGMLIVTIVGVAITTLGIAAAGLWTYNESVSKHFDSIEAKLTESFKIIFRRVDENKESYWKNFVTKEIHDIQLNNTNAQMMTGFKNLSDQIKALSDSINKNDNHKGE